MTEPYSVLSLFAGIGGFDLGLERTGGFKTVAFCEIDPFCRRVLAKYWPGVPIYDDVRTLTATRLSQDGVGYRLPDGSVGIDVMCGGFPCQDISSAGARKGINGERSGLWSEYARLIGELRPGYVIVENVADLLHRGLDRVLGDLAALGYDAEWHCIPAAAVDAPHFRDRLWIVAHPNCGCVHCEHADAGNGGSIQAEGFKRELCRSCGGESAVAYANRQPLVGAAIARQERHPWPPEPPVDRVDNGLSARVAREQLRALGNAVVPQIPELIGRAILAAEAA